MKNFNQSTPAHTSIAAISWHYALCVMIALILTMEPSSAYMAAQQDSTGKPQKAYPNTGVRYEGGDTTKNVAKDDTLRIYLETRTEAGKIPYTTLLVITEGGRVDFRWRTAAEAVVEKEKSLTIQLTKKEWKNLFALYTKSRQSYDAVDIGDVLFAVAKQTIYVEKGAYGRAISYLLEPKLAAYPKMYDDHIRRQFQLDEKHPLWQFIQTVRSINDRFQTKQQY
jgi:hypothetical protein